MTAGADNTRKRKLRRRDQPFNLRHLRVHDEFLASQAADINFHSHEELFVYRIPYANLSDAAKEFVVVEDPANDFVLLVKRMAPDLLSSVDGEIMWLPKEYEVNWIGYAFRKTTLGEGILPLAERTGSG